MMTNASASAAMVLAAPSSAKAAAEMAGEATKAKTGNMVNYESFLQLLVAQMKNQDPTQPTDSGEYLSQLASFSSVEQAIQTNEKLDALLAQGSLAQAGGLVGRRYTSADATGVIASVTLGAEGLTLTLDNGKKVKLGDGVTIS
jgi:flagellar basal-body rod modification protein FlgD